MPAASWDKNTHTWTVGLAGKIVCDANSEGVAGIVSLVPTGGNGPLAPLEVSGRPNAINRVTRAGLAPGVYNLIWDAAVCYAQPQDENDNGLHGDSFESVQIRQVELWDCATPGQARYTPRMTSRPLIAVAPDLPPDAPILCPPVPLDPCQGGGARAAAVHPSPLIAYRGGPSVQPCTPKGAPDTPAASVDCPPGSHARASAWIRSPLVVPIRGPLPKSTKGGCSGEVKVVVDKPTPPPPCKTRVVHDPLIAVRCTPKPPGPAQGYAAAVTPVKPLARIRFLVPAGRRETLKMKLTSAARARLQKPGTAVRFVMSYRTAGGRVYTARSAPMSFEP